MLSELNKKFKTYYINLEYNSNGRNEMIKRFNDENISNYHIYRGENIQEMKPSYFIYNLFRNNDFNYNKDIIANALDHYNIWNELINSEYDFFIVYEDDIQFTVKYNNKLEKILKTTDFSMCDYLFLGYSMFNHRREKNSEIYNYEKENIEVKILNREMYIGSTFSYLITKVGAIKILDYINQNGIKYRIDHFIEMIPNLNIYETQPHLCFLYKLNDFNDKDTFDFDNIILKIRENYKFFHYLDYPDYDIQFIPNKTKKELFLILSEYPETVAFNTLGFLKNRVEIDKLVPSMYYKTIKENYDLTDENREGIMIHKNEIEKYKINRKQINIKIICDIPKLLEQYSWYNLNFTQNDHADYYIIIDNPNNKYFEPDKTILFKDNSNYDNKFLHIIKKPDNFNILDSNYFFQTVEKIIDSHLEYKKYFNNLKKMDYKIVCFIHSCTINNNLIILKNLISKIIDTNLISKLDLIIINNIGDSIDISDLNLFQDINDKFYLINYSCNPLFFEIPTINLIHSFSLFNPDIKLLYLHTKGSSYNNLNSTIADWINLLIYVNIENHDKCLKNLDDYDCVGCNYYLSPEKHFSGNFWWSKTNYIRKLDRINNLIRLKAEFWLCSREYAKIKSLHNSHTDHYYWVYPP